MPKNIGGRISGQTLKGVPNCASPDCGANAGENFTHSSQKIGTGTEGCEVEDREEDRDRH